MLLAGYFSPAWADINIELRATVVNIACSVVSSDSNKTVDLGHWPTKQLKTAGSTTPPVPFSLRLKGCPPGSASITFSGKKASSTGLLALSDSVMAQKVAIELRDGNRVSLALEAASQAIPVDKNGNTVLHFYANYIALVDNPTPGIAKSDATFTLNYY
ncbi:fimbria assembly protein [Kosakonia sp. BYX6]|uniref:Fimbria assembly protein n=1 Tax=Kosakonia calanthes TaxID=3139408 RepID=A0ABZ3BCW2_9ENTR